MSEKRQEKVSEKKTGEGESEKAQEKVSQREQASVEKVITRGRRVVEVLP